jgi:hypothetical protein
VQLPLTASRRRPLFDLCRVIARHASTVVTILAHCSDPYLAAARSFGASGTRELLALEMYSVRTCNVSLEMESILHIDRACAEGGGAHFLFQSFQGSSWKPTFVVDAIHVSPKSVYKYVKTSPFYSALYTTSPPHSLSP